MIDEYRKMLDQLFESNSSSIISNSSTAHAIPLIAKLFQHAKKEVMIFTGAMNTDIYGVDEVVDSAGTFLIGNEGKLSIIVQKSSDMVSDEDLVSKENCLIEKIKNRFGDTALHNVSLFRASADLSTVNYHFMVVDGSAFRYEPDNTKHEALASFNHKEVGEKLESIFNEMVSSGTSAAIQLH